MFAFCRVSSFLRGKLSSHFSSTLCSSTACTPKSHRQRLPNLFASPSWALHAPPTPPKPVKPHLQAAGFVILCKKPVPASALETIHCTNFCLLFLHFPLLILRVLFGQPNIPPLQHILPSWFSRTFSQSAANNPPSHQRCCASILPVARTLNNILFIISTVACCLTSASSVCSFHSLFRQKVHCPSQENTFPNIIMCTFVVDILPSL